MIGAGPGLLVVAKHHRERVAADARCGLMSCCGARRRAVDDAPVERRGHVQAVGQDDLGALHRRAVDLLRLGLVHGAKFGPVVRVLIAHRDAGLLCERISARLRRWRAATRRRTRTRYRLRLRCATARGSMPAEGCEQGAACGGLVRARTGVRGVCAYSAGASRARHRFHRHRALSWIHPLARMAARSSSSGPALGQGLGQRDAGECEHRDADQAASMRRRSSDRYWPARRPHLDRNRLADAAEHEHGDQKLMRGMDEGEDGRRLRSPA